MVKADQAAGLRKSQPNFHPPKAAGSRVSAPKLSIAVTSGKGGVGKTQLAANLAVALAQRGLKTLLLDADLGLAGLDLALGITPAHTLNEVLDGKLKPEDIVCEGPCGLRLLPACPGRYEMANLAPSERDLLTNAIDHCAASYDVLLTDTGAGINSNSVSFAAGADEVLLIATPDPTSMRDAYAMAKVLAKRAGLETIRFVANQVSGEAQGAEQHATLSGLIRRFLPIELTYLGCIPRDELVRQGAASGSPFILRAPDSKPARAIQAIAQRLVALNPERDLC
ncbi:MAG: P-loop NTPase [Polyangiales bacterium]